MNLLEQNLVPFKTILKSETGNRFLFCRIKQNDLDGYPIIAVAMDEDDGGEVEDGELLPFRVGEAMSFTKFGKYESARNTPNVDIVSVSKPWIPKRGDRVIVSGAGYRRDPNSYGDGANLGNWFHRVDGVMMSDVSDLAANPSNAHANVKIGETEWWVHLRNLSRHGG